MQQATLIKRSPEEIDKIKIELAGLVRKFIDIEEQKKESNDEFNKQLGDLWKNIQGLTAALKD